MGSKLIVSIGLLLAMVLFIFTEVAAGKLTETSNAVDTYVKTTRAEVNDDNGRCASIYTPPVGHSDFGDGCGAYNNKRELYDYGGDGHRGDCRYGC
ncbi:hypothetical protein CASFOL_021532 [Castilleja foliolosa]|uniref:Uncharacterized protein n=1 Tax=Castilleja foliolosa TaxID=1961234 RepID=A0ABD3CWV5_9LAMI